MRGRRQNGTHGPNADARTRNKASTLADKYKTNNQPKYLRPMGFRQNMCIDTQNAATEYHKNRANPITQEIFTERMEPITRQGEDRQCPSNAMP